MSRIVFENAVVGANLMKGTAMKAINVNRANHPDAIACYRVSPGS